MENSGNKPKDTYVTFKASEISPEERTKLEEHGKLFFRSEIKKLTAKDLENVVGFLTSDSWKLSEDERAKLPRGPHIYVTRSSGYNKVHPAITSELSDNGKFAVRLANVTGVTSPAIATHTYKEIIDIFREGRDLRKDVGNAKLSKEFYGENVAGKNCGVWGLGENGYRVAQACASQPSPMNISYANGRSEPYSAEKLGDLKDATHYQTPEEMAPHVDVFVIGVPLYHEGQVPQEKVTQGKVDARFLKLLKPRALVVNIARAEIVNDNDMYDALHPKIRIQGDDESALLHNGLKERYPHEVRELQQKGEDHVYLQKMNVREGQTAESWHLRPTSVLLKAPEQGQSDSLYAKAEQKTRELNLGYEAGEPIRLLQSRYAFFVVSKDGTKQEQLKDLGEDAKLAVQRIREGAKPVELTEAEQLVATTLYESKPRAYSTDVPIQEPLPLDHCYNDPEVADRVHNTEHRSGKFYGSNELRAESSAQQMLQAYRGERGERMDKEIDLGTEKAKEQNPHSSPKRKSAHAHLGDENSEAKKIKFDLVAEPSSLQPSGKEDVELPPAMEMPQASREASWLEKVGPGRDAAEIVNAGKNSGKFEFRRVAPYSSKEEFAKQGEELKNAYIALCERDSLTRRNLDSIEQSGRIVIFLHHDDSKTYNALYKRAENTHFAEQSKDGKEATFLAENRSRDDVISFHVVSAGELRSFGSEKKSALQQAASWGLHELAGRIDTGEWRNRYGGPTPEPLSEHELELFKNYDSSIISDAISHVNKQAWDYLNGEGVDPMMPLEMYGHFKGVTHFGILGKESIVGPVVTAHCTVGDNGAMKPAIDKAKPGCILVVLNKGEEAALGGSTMQAIEDNKFKAVVVSGNIRDVVALKDRLPVFMLNGGVITPEGPMKGKEGLWNRPLKIGVKPGDTMVLDQNGITYFESTRRGDVLVKAEQEVLKAERKLDMPGESQRRMGITADEMRLRHRKSETELGALVHPPEKELDRLENLPYRSSRNHEFKGLGSMSGSQVLSR